MPARLSEHRLENSSAIGPARRRSRFFENVEPALSVWEAHIKASTLLAKITPALVEDVKLRRAQDVAHGTVDKDLAVLKAQSGRVEAGLSREILQRRQLATPVSHRGRVRASTL
jgi:hypothetical protein